MDGVITCENCKMNNNFSLDDNPFYEKGLNKPISIVSKAVVDAINYIVFAKQERVLSFNINNDDWTSFFDVAEKFLLNHLERGFFSLDFYKSLFI